MHKYLKLFKVFLLSAVLFLQAKAQENYVKIGNINIEGNQKTKPAIIFRELAIQVGDTLKISQVDSLLEIDRRKINNTNLFNFVKLALRYTNVQQADLVITLEERWYFVALPVFYLADRNFNEWWYDHNHDFKRTIYGLYVSHKNLTGNADRLKLRAELGFVPLVELSYAIPYLDKKQKTGLMVGAFYANNRTMAYRNWNDKLDFYQSNIQQQKRYSAFTEITRREGFYGFQKLELSYNYSQVSDSIVAINPNYFLDGKTKQRFFLASYSYRYDRRDNVQYALRGYQFFFQATQYGILKKDNLHQSNFVSSFSHFIPLKNKFYYNYSLRGKLSLPKQQPFPQTVGLGYRNDFVRGYELYVIDGQNYAILKNNFRRELLKKAFKLPDFMPQQFGKVPAAFYLNLFTDIGYVRNYQPQWSNTKLGNKTLIGYGLGLDCVTWYNSVLRLNFARNAIGENKFFFNLAREF